MLTKIIGTCQNITMSGTAQTVTVTTNAGTAPYVIRVATNSQPAFINFGTTATNQSVLLPSNYVETFKLASTSTVSVLQAGTAGIVSIVAVA